MKNWKHWKIIGFPQYVHICILQISDECWFFWPNLNIKKFYEYENLKRISSSTFCFKWAQNNCAILFFFRTISRTIHSFVHLNLQGNFNSTKHLLNANLYGALATHPPLFFPLKKQIRWSNKFENKAAAPAFSTSKFPPF